jgi:hypothetical protein
MLFGSTYAWWLEERYNANPAGNNADTLMYGAQLGAKFALFGGETRVAAHYYDLGGGQYSNPFYVANGVPQPNGNTTITQVQARRSVLRYDYDVIMVRGGQHAGRRAAAAVLGRLRVEHGRRRSRHRVRPVPCRSARPATRRPGSRVVYQSMDKDALFAQLIDSGLRRRSQRFEGWC